MLEFRPIGYRVLAEMVGKRKFTTPIVLPDKTEIDGTCIWVVRELGDEMILVSGERVPIYQVKIGEEIMFDSRRAAEACPPMLCGGRILALVDVEGIFCVVSGTPEPILPKANLLIAKNMPPQRAA